MSVKKFVQIAVNLPIKSVFDYSVPSFLQEKLAPGKRVWVPFGKRTIVGCIVGIMDKTKIKRTKDIKEIIDEEPLISEEMLELTRWMADYYFCSWGEAIDAAIPRPFKKGKTSLRLRIKEEPWPKEKPQEKAAENILTAHQDKALTKITQHLNKEEFGVFLLHGITASGKTEVYFAAIEEVLKKNKSAIVFVPEISLTPQAIERFVQRFGQEIVAVAHSRLSNSEKFLEWQKIRSGQAKIVIGARSAIFSPFQNLGLIVVDEEHENTYKQEDAPRYHLVTTAIKRAQLNEAVVILGSATPSLESYYQAKRGHFELIELPERIEGRLLPTVQIVDMNEQRRISKRQTIISKVLADNISNCLKKGEQVILFLNRRGFSTFLSCAKCGYVVKCKRCNVALVYHFDYKSLVCHHCNYKTEPPQICPECDSGYIRYFGIGTQKVESELHRLFPQAAIGRMDSDALAKKTAHFEAFTDFKTGKVNIMVGTQVLAKGFDFPKVTLVGVISADVTLNLPDFRASERTFSLLTQVAGRAGRGEIPGKVIIQTYTPEHYVISFAINHDFNSFYKQEIVFRKQLQLPPFMHIVGVMLRGKDENILKENAELLAQTFAKENKKKELYIVGPAPMPISKIRGYHRWVILLKGKEVLKINKLLKKCLEKCKLSAKLRLTVDVDPQALI